MWRVGALRRNELVLVVARNRRSRKRDGEHEPLDVSSLMLGARRTETRNGSEWIVQPIGAASAVKAYTCPGCSLEIAPGVAHLVAWRADDMFGDDAAIEQRRHWHTHCWKVAR